MSKYPGPHVITSVKTFSAFTGSFTKPRTPDPTLEDEKKVLFGEILVVMYDNPSLLLNIVKFF